MFSESDLLPISALQHLLFCERQCALIHIERLWAENRLTVEGRHLHEKAHGGRDETRGAVRITRGLPLRNFTLGLFGVADVVEFHADAPAGGAATGAAPLEAMRGNNVGDAAGCAVGDAASTAMPAPFPIEYKRGRPKRDDSDRVQLCAQAMCLEEMFAVTVPAGALYYGRTRRRLDVAFDHDLRRTTNDAAARLHALIAAGVTPRVKRQPKCEKCSLLNLCLPGAADPSHSAARYVKRALAASLAGAPAGDDDM